MKTHNYVIIIGILSVITLVAGCIGGDSGDDEENDDNPDSIQYINAGTNGLSSSYVDFTDHMESTHVKIVIMLDKIESVEEHIFYLYLFEGDEPDTTMVGLDGVKPTLEIEAIEEFTMSWDDSEITWEVDIDTSLYDHYTIGMWHPDRDEYDDDIPNAYVDVEIYFS